MLDALGERDASSTISRSSRTRGLAALDAAHRIRIAPRSSAGGSGWFGWAAPGWAAELRVARRLLWSSSGCWMCIVDTGDDREVDAWGYLMKPGYAAFFISLSGLLSITTGTTRVQ